jgi:hypothetical protein
MQPSKNTEPEPPPETRDAVPYMHARTVDNMVVTYLRRERRPDMEWMTGWQELQDIISSRLPTDWRQQPYYQLKDTVKKSKTDYEVWFWLCHVCLVVGCRDELPGKPSSCRTEQPFKVWRLCNKLVDRAVEKLGPVGLRLYDVFRGMVSQ